MTVAEVSQKFTDALGNKFLEKEFSVMAGRKYDRIVVAYPGDRSTRSCHAFVERETGALLKSAGWAAPAKGVRFDLSTEEGFAQAEEAADVYGSYLYKR